MYNGYDYNTAAYSATGLVGIMGGLTLGIFIFSGIICLIAIISYAKIFTKAGKPWWASIIPIYNTIVMIEIAKLPLWYIALFFIPIANIYALFKINIEIAKNFGKGAGFGVGMTLVSIIFIPLLAFSDNKYEDVNIVSENVANQFNANNVINNNVSVDNTTIGETIENVNLENNPFAPVEPVVEPVVNIPVEPTPVAEPIQNVPVEPVVEPVVNIPVEPTPVVEPIQNVPIEPVVEPMVNIPVEPTPVAEPIQNVPVEPVVERVVNIPVEPTPVAEPIQNVPVEPVVAPIESSADVNAFNMSPESLVTDVINEPQLEQLNVSSIENDLTTNIVQDKKVCKSCGNELPDIVSICPNCGTDNE